MLAQETLGKEYKSQFDMIYPELAKKFKISFYHFYWMVLPLTLS